jgi:hypothetical protein
LISKRGIVGNSLGVDVMAEKTIIKEEHKINIKKPKLYNSYSAQ